MAGPRQGATWQVRDRWIGTPCRVKLDIYLVGYAGERGEEQREKERNGGREVTIEATSLRERQKREELRLEAEDQLASVEGGGSVLGLSLKGTDHYIPISFYNKKKWEVRHHRLKELGQWILKTSSCLFVGVIF